jgi:hypothetical protein
MDDFSSEPGSNDAGPLISSNEMYGPPYNDVENPSSTGGQERFGMGAGSYEGKKL